jgi:hypothetical protein
MRAILVTPAAVLTLGVLAACAPMQWAGNDATPEQVSQDLMRCQQDAWREAQYASWYYRPFGPFAGRNAFGRPFAFPASPYYDPFNDPYLQEARLTQFCMRNKGYELTPAEEKQ